MRTRLQRLPWILSVLALSLGAATLAPVGLASAGGLVRAPNKSALTARRKAVKSERRRTARTAKAQWKRLGRLGESLATFGESEIKLDEVPVDSSPQTGHVASPGFTLVQRLVLVKGQAPQRTNRITGQVEPAREGYTPMVDVVQIDPQGARQRLGRYSLGSEKEREAGSVNFSFQQVPALVGSASGTTARALRARTRQAHRNWMLVRRLSKELARDLGEDEEVFLGEGLLTSVPGVEAVNGHRVNARMFLVRQATRQQRTRLNRATGRNENFTPTSLRVVVRAREVDAQGNLVQEMAYSIGGTTNGESDLAPTELTELLGSIPSDTLIETANASIGAMAHESE